MPLYLADGIKATEVASSEDLEAFLRRRETDRLTPHGAYTAVPIVFRGIKLRANAVQAFPMELLDAQGNDLLVTQPDAWKGLIRGFRARLWQTEASLCLYGASYLILDRNRYGLNLTPRWVLPALMHPETDNDRGLTGFTRTVQRKDGTEVKTLLDLDQVAWTWLPPLDKELGYGVAPAAVALGDADLLSSADRMVQADFDRGGVKGTILFVDTGNRQLEDDRADRLETRFARWVHQLRKGIREAFEPLALGSNVDVREFGMNPQEAQVDALSRDAKEDIAQALEIPMSKLFSNAANYATAQQDDVAFYNELVIPEVEMIVESWNERMLDPLDLRLVLHPERIEAMQTAQLQQAQSVLPLFQAGILDRTEVRDILGYTAETEAVEGGDPDAVDVTPDDAVGDELRMWRRMALTRYREGRPDKALKFAPDVLPEPLVEAIRGALEGAQTAEAAEAVFASAMTWKGYP